MLHVEASHAHPASVSQQQQQTNGHLVSLAASSQLERATLQRIKEAEKRVEKRAEAEMTTRRRRRLGIFLL